MQSLSLKSVEDALQNADPETRHRTLRAVANLFLENAPIYSEDKVDVFDHVLVALLNDSTHADLLEISCRMAPVENAPRRLVKNLAGNYDISIAGPVLSQSPRLSAEDLCHIARSKSNLHMLAISRRTEVAEPVTEILLERGDDAVASSVVGNVGARLSSRSIVQVLDRGQTNRRLVDHLQSRPDISEAAIKEAEAQLEKSAMRREWATAIARDRVKLLLDAGAIGELQVKNFAVESDYEAVVASISILGKLNCDVVDNMLRPNRVSGIILVCKAVGFAWTTVDEILRLAKSQNGVSDEEAAQAHKDYINMKKATAERIIRFWQVRQSITA